MPKIILKNINFRYDTVSVLEYLSINFEDKKINVLIGPSASGKTTLLKIIAGILKPQSGSLINKPRKISYVFQDERLIEELTVSKNLSLVLQNTSYLADKKEELINHYLTLTGLLDVKDMYPHQLSGSMRYRLSLARAFIYPSETLIMDEPFSGLDIKLKQDIINKFIELWNKDKKTVIYVTHNIDDALKLAHIINVMSDRPLSTSVKITFTSDISKRNLADKNVNKARAIIYKQIDKWK